MPSFADTETTFAELQARIAKTIDFVKGFNTAQIDGSEERSCILKIRGEEMKFRGQDYLFKLALPNFFFHVTTTYDILRHNGVELGKMDYLEVVVRRAHSPSSQGLPWDPRVKS